MEIFGGRLIDMKKHISRAIATVKGPKKAVDALNEVMAESGLKMRSKKVNKDGGVRMRFKSVEEVQSSLEEFACKK